VLAEIERLQKATGEPGILGIEVQPMTPEVATSAQASAGVIVTTIDPASTAADELLPTEVIEAIDGVEITTPDHWRARAARVTVGETVTLRVRGVDGVREVSVAALPQATSSSEPARGDTLGLTLRTLPKIGSEVVEVQAGSRADRAGIREGDVITVVSGRPSPTRADVLRAFAALPDGGSSLVALTRGAAHHVTVVQK
jgi:S1-C subfamily serine protease